MVENNLESYSIRLGIQSSTVAVERLAVWRLCLRGRAPSSSASLPARGGHWPWRECGGARQVFGEVEGHDSVQLKLRGEELCLDAGQGHKPLAYACFLSRKGSPFCV